MATKKPVAIAITRVSTKDQAENNHSLEQQDSSVAAMAATLDVPIVETWSMHTSAKVGANLKRKDLNAALRYCKLNPNVKYLLLDKVSRLARDIEIVFYYRVEFGKCGAKILFCDPTQQKFNGEDAAAKFELARAAYQAEAENEERSITCKTKMQARVALGYYPGMCHQGYKATTARDGLHVPDEPRFSLLQQALKKIAKFEMTMKEAVRWLKDNGYTTRSGEILDLNHFRENIAMNPYYAGIIAIKDWSVNEKGLHTPMITKEEYEIIKHIAQGQPIPRKSKRRPDFPLVLNRHFECRKKDNGKLTPRFHKNGKGWQQAEYVCRCCQKVFKRDVLNDNFRNVLSQICYSDNCKRVLSAAIRIVWRNNEQHRIDYERNANRRLSELEGKKSSLVMAIATEGDSELVDEYKTVLTDIKAQIAAIQTEVAHMGNLDDDFQEFTEFCLNYIDSLANSFFKLTPIEQDECKHLLFFNEIYVDNDRFVYTPNISPLYRLKTEMDSLEAAQIPRMVELPGIEPGSEW